MLPLLFLVFSVFCVAEEMVITPYGIRRASCILEVPHDAVVTPVKDSSNRLLVSHPTNTFIHTVPAHCGDDIDSIRQRSRRAVPTEPQAINGWLDNAGWYPPGSQNQLNSFTSTYVVPGNPSVMSSQVLFYFIGMQDNDAPKAVNIIQPVLTWGNGNQRWYMESWACCPSNITVHSPALFGLVPGSKVGATIERLSDSIWRIDSEFNGQHTTLNAQVGDYNYNWADVTLEVYNVDPNQCGMFGPGPAYFNDLTLKDKQGQTLNPGWGMTGGTACGGKIVRENSNTIYIQHS